VHPYYCPWPHPAATQIPSDSKTTWAKCHFSENILIFRGALERRSAQFGNHWCNVLRMEVGRNLLTSSLLFRVNSGATYNIVMFTNFVFIYNMNVCCWKSDRMPLLLLPKTNPQQKAQCKCNVNQHNQESHVCAFEVLVTKQSYVICISLV
jgi:hypothetical protein